MFVNNNSGVVGRKGIKYIILFRRERRTKV
jgi:hypothetical protein